MEINRLKAELAIRPRDPNARVVELQDELEQYKLIAGESLCSSACWRRSLGTRID